jgi:hypothetical protein
MTVQPYGYYVPQPITDKRKMSDAHLALSILTSVLLLGYGIPWLIAAARGKSNVGVICAINLATGWTIIGWWVAFFMALTPHRVVAFR